MHRTILALLVALTGSQFASAADEAKPADPGAAQPKITFDEHVAPIMREHCLTCHNQNEAKSDLALDSFARTMQGGAGGEVVVAGDLESSRLYALVAHLETPKMPPNQDKIADAKIDLLKKWILGGALENSGSKAKIKPKVDLQLVVTAGNKPSGPPAMPEKFRREPFVAASRSGASTGIAASPWAPLVAVAGQKQIILYNTDTLQLLTILPFPEGVPHVLKFSRNGAVLLAGGGRGGASGKVVLFDVKTGDRITEIGDELDVVLAADVSNDLSLVALGGPKKMVRVYNVEDGTQEYELKKHTDWIYAVEFSPDGAMLATADRSAGLIVWEARTGREYQNLTGHTGPITDVSWRSDSNLLASCSEDGSLKVWDLNGGKMYKSWNANKNALSVEFGMQGSLISAGRDNTAKVWDLEGKQLCQTEALPDMTMDAVLTHDQGRIIVGDWSGVCRVYDGKSGKRIGELSMNPLPLAQRVSVMAQQAAEAEKLAATAAAEAATAKQAFDAASAAVAGALKKLEDGAKQIADLEQSKPKLEREAARKAENAKQSASKLGELRKKLTDAKAAEAKATEAAAKDKARENAVQLAANLKSAEEKAAQEDAEAKSLAKQAADAGKLLPSLKGQVKPNKDAAEKAAAAKTAAEKTWGEKQAAAKLAAENAASARAAAQQAAADKAEFEKLSSQASAVK